MSVRDEIARALRERCEVCGERTADTLLPIVERVAREAAEQAAAKFPEIIASGRMGWLCGLSRDEVDAIVRRVMGNE